MKKIDKIKSILESGIKDHQLERKLLPELHSIADKIGKTFGKVLKREDTSLASFAFNLKPPEGQGVRIVYGANRKGATHDGDPWFPFPHDHCYFNFCFKWVTEDLDEIEICVELELPCHVRWPF
jgi:hypothetical protein